MNTLDIEQLKVLFELNERCHTVLADAFPHAGLKAIGGSRVMLREPLLGVLKKCFTDISSESKKLPSLRGQTELAAVWIEACQLLERIEKQCSSESAERINNAATLLYLTSGATWNYLRTLEAAEPPHNARYVRIESLLPLLTRCGRGGDVANDVQPEQLIKRLCLELSSCLL